MKLWACSRILRSRLSKKHLRVSSTAGANQSQEEAIPNMLDGRCDASAKIPTCEPFYFRKYQRRRAVTVLFDLCHFSALSFFCAVPRLLLLHGSLCMYPRSNARSLGFFTTYVCCCLRVCIDVSRAILFSEARFTTLKQAIGKSSYQAPSEVPWRR